MKERRFAWLSVACVMTPLGRQRRSFFSLVSGSINETRKADAGCDVLTHFLSFHLFFVCSFFFFLGFSSSSSSYFKEKARSESHAFVFFDAHAASGGAQWAAASEWPFPFLLYFFFFK